MGIITALLICIIFVLGKKAVETKKVIYWIVSIFWAIILIVWMGVRPKITQAIKTSIIQQVALSDKANSKPLSSPDPVNEKYVSALVRILQETIAQKTTSSEEPLLNDPSIFVSKKSLLLAVNERKHQLVAREDLNIENLISEVKLTSYNKCMNEYTFQICKVLKDVNLDPNQIETLKKVNALKFAFLKADLETAEFILQNFSEFNKNNFSFRKRNLQQELEKKYQKLVGIGSEIEKLLQTR